MADRNVVKARGRSRARSQGQTEAVRRPGQQASSQSQQAPEPGQPAVPATGRVARGSVHQAADVAGPSRPGGAVESVSSSLSALALQSGGNGGNGARGAGRGAWRGRDFGRDPVTRPTHVTDKKGESGNPCTVVANFFRLKSTPSWVIYQYHVDFSPDVDNIRFRRGLLHEHSELLQIYNFDGAILYTIFRLEQNEMDVFSKNRRNDEMIKMHIKLTKEVSAQDPIVMNIMGIQLRKYMSILKFKLINRLYYDQAGEKITASRCFRVWPGFSTAVHPYDAGTMLCADLCFKILRYDTVLDQLKGFLQQNREQFREIAARKLIGSIILTRYNNMTYRIDDIDWNKNPESTFLKNGQEVRYCDYYAQHWNQTITDKKQPLLVSMPKKSDIKRGRTDPVLLIPELSFMTGISDEMRSDFNIMKDISTHTRVGPDERAQELTGFMKRMLANPEVQKDMAAWKLSFENQLVSFPARVQRPELISQGNKSYSYVDKDAEWVREMRGNTLIRTIAIEKYVIIAPGKDMQLCKNFIDVLYKVCAPMGIELAFPAEVRLSTDRATDYTRALESSIQPGVQLVICVVPNVRKDRYDAIKKCCCIDHPVASQVIVSRTISKPAMLMSVATKIGIQLNCKLGGAAWAVDVPIKNVMLIGYDSYHDSSLRGRSVGAVCASFDERLTHYYSGVKFGVSREEMVDGLETNVIAAIRHYYVVRKTMPDRIIVYRDGVGEGQLGHVKDFEIKQIQACFKQIGTNFSPRLTFIVVNKKITTRIFQQQGQKMTNPIPGTTVDTTITRPEFYDFFLVSQSVRQGTVSPTQYNVIHDESGLRPDHIQRLTFKLTHLYYNWPGTIRVPAPCLYAHKLAFLTGQSLHSPPSEVLADTLFFL